jgi:hypothetical protein
MDRRSSRPDEQPPRRRGGRMGWLVGSVPALIAIAFVAIAIIVAIIVLAS